MKTYAVSWRETPDGEVMTTTVEAEHAREAAQQVSAANPANIVFTVEPEDRSEPPAEFGGRYRDGGLGA